MLHEAKTTAFLTCSQPQGKYHEFENNDVKLLICAVCCRSHYFAQINCLLAPDILVGRSIVIFRDVVHSIEVLKWIVRIDDGSELWLIRDWGRMLLFHQVLVLRFSLPLLLSDHDATSQQAWLLILFNVVLRNALTRRLLLQRSVPAFYHGLVWILGLELARLLRYYVS